ncbi:MAG TPA: protein kinase [Mycobacteriales bacterium]|nr:protein kinase [Mycobacteriales bacterium]
MTLRENVLIAGRYRVERKIGSGGMGAVWLAIDESTERPVALKHAHPGRNERELRREARIARDIDDPRIVRLLDAVVDDGTSWLVMEYVPSRDLAGIIETDGALPAGAVARIGEQVARALETLHARGIVHGDVSPGNILIDEKGDAKLTDFGVARSIHADATLTGSGLVPGTPAYVAPEVARGGDRTPASDVFSLGAALFAAVEGKSPLGEDDNPLTVIWRAASGHISAPSAGPLGRALAALLRPEPAARPTAAAAAELLRTADAETPASSRRRMWTVLTAAAVVAVVAASVIITQLTGSNSNHGAGGAVATLGDPHTADWCALLQPSTLKQFGTTDLSVDYGNFDRCDVLISKNDDDLVDVELSVDRGPAPKSGPVAHRGAVTVTSQPASDDECDEFLSLKDGNMVIVGAKLTGGGHLNLCAAASAAADHAIRILNAGPVPRLSGQQPGRSLSTVDACGLIGRSALTEIPQLAGTRPDPGFGNWGCEWSDDSGGFTAQLRFDRDYPPTTRDRGTPATLQGRPAFVRAGDDGPHTCVARLVAHRYTDAAGDAKTELVEVSIEAPQPAVRLCADAETLGSAAAKKLPKA